MSIDHCPPHTDAVEVKCNGTNCPNHLYVAGRSTDEGVRAAAALAHWSAEAGPRSTKDYCPRCTKERAA